MRPRALRPTSTDIASPADAGLTERFTLLSHRRRVDTPAVGDRAFGMPAVGVLAVAMLAGAAATLAAQPPTAPQAAAAQGPTVRGRVVAAGDSAVLAGITVVEEGTTNGTVTRPDGSFTLTLTRPTAQLRVRGLGYAPRVVPATGAGPLTITLERSAAQLSQVVVTALGVEREKRALPYAVSEVRSEQLTQAAPLSTVSALYGKTTGVALAQTAAGPTGNTNITIRGVKSLTGNSRPLVVVDGIPIRDRDSGFSPLWGYENRDDGTGLNSVNPNDIEAVSVLKGANAAALYGAQAANGVLLITTKKGRSVGRMGVEVNTSYTRDAVASLPEFQNEFGAGASYISLEGRSNDGTFPLDAQGRPMIITSSRSFGPRMTGQNVLWWDDQMRPYAPQPDNLRQLYPDGSTGITTVALSNALERASFRLGLTRNDWKGVFPGARQAKNTASLTSNVDVGSRLRADVAVNYYNARTVNPPTKNYVGYGLPRSFRADMLTSLYKTEEGFQLTARELPRSPAYERQAMNELLWRGLEDRYEYGNDELVGSLGLTYRFADWLRLNVKGGSNLANGVRDEQRASTQAEAVGPTGGYFVTRVEDRVNYGQALLAGERALPGRLRLAASVGAASQRTRHAEEYVGTNGGLVVENWFSVSNSKNTPDRSVWRGEDQTDGVFGSADLTWRDYLTLSLTGRRDWTSTLPTSNNSYFYPSAGLSFVFSDAVSLPSWVTSGKARLNYAEVGRGGARYQAVNAYNYGTWNGVTVNSFSTVVPPLALRPERKRETEAGLDMSFLDGRVGFEASYYRQRNFDQIMNLDLPNSSGASAITVNAGLITNRGAEAQLFVTPLRRPNLEWDATFNYSRNVNRVERLAAGVQYLQFLNVEDNIFIQARPGHAFGDIYGYVHALSPDGQKVVTPDGLYARSDTIARVGNTTPTWVGGLTNSVRWRGVRLSAVVDMRVGGDIVSLTNYYGYATGKWKETLAGRDEAHGGLPYYIDDAGNAVRLPSHDARAPGGKNVYHDGIILPGVKRVFGADGQVTGYAANDKLIPIVDYYFTNWDWNNPSSLYTNAVYDNSYAKLREVSLDFAVPARFTRRFAAQNVHVALIGRNLGYLFKRVPNIDPEAAINSDPRYQGYEYAWTPAMRSLGFQVRATF
jgi:iron complex outermembrane recepter protein